jgi:hypothetical protein
VKARASASLRAWNQREIFKVANGMAGVNSTGPTFSSELSNSEWEEIDMDVESTEFSCGEVDISEPPAPVTSMTTAACRVLGVPVPVSNSFTSWNPA